MNPKTGNSYFKPKCKGFKYSGSSEEYYKKGLEILNPPMKKFFNSLEVSPKVLFVKLHKSDNQSSNGCLYKLRNKSTIQVLTPSEVKQLAKRDVELMYQIVRRKILSLGKLNTLIVNNTWSRINRSRFNNGSEISNQILSKKRNPIRLVEKKSSSLPPPTCPLCKKTFSDTTCLKHHMKTCHSTLNVSDSRKFDKKCSRSPLSELSILDQNESSQALTKQETSTKFAKFDKQLCNSKEPDSSTRQNKIHEKRISNDFCCQVLCCVCLKMIVEVRPLLDPLFNSVSLQCMYCELRLSGDYFLHHIATSHLLCKLDECHSKNINTGYRLRQVLTMEDEFECIHVDCDHYKFIDLSEPNVTITVDDVDLDQIITCKEEDSQDNNESEANFEIRKGEEKQKEDQVLSDPSNSKSVDSFTKSEDSTGILSEDITLQCSVCKKKFKGEQKLLKHIFIEHRFTFPFTCYVCFSSYKDSEEFKIHIQTHTANVAPANTDLQHLHVEKKPLSITENVELAVNASESTTNFVEESIQQDEENVENVENVEIEIPCVVKNVENTEIFESTITENFFEETIHRDEEYPSGNCEIEIPCVVKNVENMELSESTTAENFIEKTIHRDEEYPSENCEIEIPCVVKNVENMELCVSTTVENSVVETINRAEKYPFENCEIKLPNVVTDMENMEFIDSESTITVNSVEETVHQDEKCPSENCEIKISCEAAKEENMEISYCESTMINNSVKEKTHQKKKDPPENYQMESSCNKVENMFVRETVSNFIEEPIYEEEKYSSKHCKVKIPCVVEKVEYPLDIHNLYAHIRKANDPTQINCAELRLQTNCSNDSNDIDMIPEERSPEKRKFVDSHETPISKPTNDMGSHVNFECKTCGRAFHSERCYNEHMFFMHDAEFNDSVVLNLLLSSPEQKMTTKPATDYLKTSKSQNSQIPIPVENDQSEKVKSKKPKLEGSPKFTNSDNLKAVPVQFPVSRNKVKRIKVMTNSVTKASKPALKKETTTSLVNKSDNLKVFKLPQNWVSTENPIKSTQSNTNKVTELSSSTKIKYIKLESANLHPCCDCKKVFITKKLLEKHIRLKHLNANKDVTKESNIASVTWKEETKMPATTWEEQPIPKNEIIDESLTCPFCDVILQTQPLLQTHLIVNHNRATDICQLCNKLFDFGRGLRHILDFHIVPHREAKQEYEFFGDGDKKEDINQAIQVLGEKKLTALYDYDNYITSKDGASFKCRNCNQSLSSIYFYRSHYLQVHDKCCTLCNLIFTNSEDFLHHLQRIHQSEKHYLWFINTFISTILLTEKTKEKLSETFQDIVRRKLTQVKLQETEENQVSNHNLPQFPETIVIPNLAESQLPVECSDAEHGSLANATLLDVSSTSNNFEFPDFCMECEVSENGTLVIPIDNGLHKPVFIENLNIINNAPDVSESVDNSTTFSTDDPNCIFDYPIIISDNVINSLQNDLDHTILTDLEANVTNNYIFDDIQLNGEI